MGIVTRKGVGDAGVIGRCVIIGSCGTAMRKEEENDSTGERTVMDGCPQEFLGNSKHTKKAYL